MDKSSTHIQEAILSMDTKSTRRIKRDWGSVFADFERSDMTVKAFCRSRGISLSLFYRRRRERRQSQPAGKPVLQADDFIELAPTALSSATISIIFPGAIELRIHRDCDRALLGEVIAQLREAAC
ncbi:hypothetical protein GF380_05775 [Candidatus Uhrbacteria bacterium]|nr:hypothetical protein [Candidatus Uhrbacteria bacterium]